MFFTNKTFFKFYMILKYEIMIMNAYYHGIIHVFLSSIESTIPNILKKIYLKKSEYSSEIFKKPQNFRTTFGQNHFSIQNTQKNQIFTKNSYIQTQHFPSKTSSSSSFEPSNSLFHFQTNAH